jgi:hypothetical protein
VRIGAVFVTAKAGRVAACTHTHTDNPVKVLGTCKQVAITASQQKRS